MLESNVFSANWSSEQDYIASEKNERVEEILEHDTTLLLCNDCQQDKWSENKDERN